MIRIGSCDAAFEIPPQLLTGFESCPLLAYTRASGLLVLGLDVDRM